MGSSLIETIEDKLREVVVPGGFTMEFPDIPELSRVFTHNQFFGNAFHINLNIESSSPDMSAGQTAMVISDILRMAQFPAMITSNVSFFSPSGKGVNVVHKAIPNKNLHLYEVFTPRGENPKLYSDLSIIADLIRQCYNLDLIPIIAQEEIIFNYKGGEILSLDATSKSYRAILLQERTFFDSEKLADVLKYLNPEISSFGVSVLSDLHVEHDVGVVSGSYMGGDGGKKATVQFLKSSERAKDASRLIAEFFTLTECIHKIGSSALSQAVQASTFKRY